MRKDLKYTQAEFAQLLDLGQSTADIERGKTKISGKAVMLLQNCMVLILYGFLASPLKKHKAQVSVMPKTLVLDREGQENIMLVSAKAAAGYPLNLGDQQWFDQQPLFNMPLPMFRGGSYRGFEIEGDSMEPGFHGGDWVFGRAIDSLMDVQNQSVYVVVLHDSVLIKRVVKEVNGQRLSLHSDNRRYPLLWSAQRMFRSFGKSLPDWKVRMLVFHSLRWIMLVLLTRRMIIRTFSLLSIVYENLRLG